MGIQSNAIRRDANRPTISKSASLREIRTNSLSSAAGNSNISIQGDTSKCIRSRQLLRREALKKKLSNKYQSSISQTGTSRPEIPKSLSLRQIRIDSLSSTAYNSTRLRRVASNRKLTIHDQLTKSKSGMIRPSSEKDKSPKNPEGPGSLSEEDITIASLSSAAGNSNHFSQGLICEGGDLQEDTERPKTLRSSSLKEILTTYKPSENTKNKTISTDAKLNISRLRFFRSSSTRKVG